MTNQTFFQNCAQTLATLTGRTAEDFIAAITRDTRSGNTQNEKVNFILNIETAVKGINEVNFSKGHKAIIGKFEYFTQDNGDLYRAPFTYPIMSDGRRCGRWEAKPNQIEEYLKMVRAVA